MKLISPITFSYLIRPSPVIIDLNTCMLKDLFKIQQGQLQGSLFFPMIYPSMLTEGKYVE